MRSTDNLNLVGTKTYYDLMVGISLFNIRTNPIFQYLSHDIWFQQCGILTSVDSDEPVQPPFKLRNFKWCSISSLTLIEY